MADTGAGLAKTGDFVRVEVDAVGQPGARAKPADAVQIIHGAQAEALQAEIFFVEGFRQVRVQAYVECVRQFGAGRHDFRVTENGEHGARAIWICAPSPRSWYS